MKQLNKTENANRLLKWLSPIALLTVAGFLSTDVFAVNINSEQLSQFKSGLEQKMEVRNSGREMSLKDLQHTIQARSQATAMGMSMMKKINKNKQEIIRNMR